MRAIATVCVSGTLDKKLRVIANAGFNAVELFEPDLLAYPGTPREVAAMMVDLGLSCALYQPFRDFEGMPGPLRQRAFDRARRKFDVMGELGADRILFCSNCSPDALSDRDRMVADLQEIGDVAASHGIMIGYEALAWGRHVNDHRDAWEIVRRADHAAVGIILDSFHSLARKVPTDSISAIDPAKIVFVQLADAPMIEMDLLYWSRHFRSLPGQGDLPVADYVAAILATGYTGPLSLEIFNDRFRATSTELVAHDSYRSLIAVEDAARRLLEEETPVVAAEPIAGVEFVEIAANDDEAKRLAPLLAALGFDKAGTHRSKCVDRWRQGAINIVVNRETTGFAGGYATVHGASICAIGLDVPSPARVMERASALDVRRFEQDPGEGNLAIPALRGVGGSLVYLLHGGDAVSIWEHEFPGSAPAPQGALLERVDHVAASVAIDEFLSWQLYWSSLFDTTRTQEVDIADPSGLVQSRAIESGHGGFRVTMNASGGRQTLSSRFVDTAFGAGFQHVAFSTDDIMGTADRLIAAGLEMLPVPPNYYPDLQARFGLADDQIEALRARGILYDEDPTGGRYWQLYTRAFEKRFFFEVVQRRGYQGYGAANAAIRLGAQSVYKPESAA